MKILVTGCCGFIGYHLSRHLLTNKKYKVYGIDNLNNYYDVMLKKDRLANIKKKGLIFFKQDIKNFNSIQKNFQREKYDYVVHLAAQAGVRHSIDSPEIYLKNNIDGFFNILENCKTYNIKHLIYASTSSVYGNNKKFPLKEESNTDKPLSFYAATKKANEVMAHSYSNIYKIPTTGLRFFTVYGPFGRPDMALFKFTKNIILGKKIDLYNKGNHYRDFTYIEDVIKYIDKIIPRASTKRIPFQIFNIGSNNPKSLKYFLNIIEENLNKISKKNYMPLQKGDIIKTHANVDNIIKKTKYTSLSTTEYGIKKFIDWYKKYYKK